MRILTAVPVYNERKYVDDVLDRIRSIHPDVLAIDDGSTDGTGERLEKRDDIALIRHERNSGYGSSIIDAFEYADANGYDGVITIDCDEQHDPQRIPDFVRALESDQWDIVSGSRYMSDSPAVNLPPGDRRLINVTLTSVTNTLFGWKLTDTFCGFKAHRVSAMKKLTLDETGYAFPMQLWPRAAAAKLRITEIPVALVYNDPTRHFGGRLDDAQFRMKHYLEVLAGELRWVPAESDCLACE